MTKPTRKTRLSRFVPDEKAFPDLTIRERDTEIIQIINEYRYLDFELLWRLLASKYSERPKEYGVGKDGKKRPKQYGFTEQALRKRLMQLFNARYLNRQPIADEPIGRGYGSPRAIYSIGPKSADFISKLTGDSIERIRSVIKSDKKQPFFLRHALEISKFRTILDLACQQSDGEVRLLFWKQGRELMDNVHDKNGNRHSVFPDAIFSLSVSGKGKVNYFLEVDRGTMPISAIGSGSDIRKKILGFWYYRKTERHSKRYYFKKTGDGQIVDLGILKRPGEQMERDIIETLKGFTVLFLTPGQMNSDGIVGGRLANILAEFPNFGRDLASSSLFWLTPLDMFELDRPESIFSKVWKTPNPKRGLRSLID